MLKFRMRQIVPPGARYFYEVEDTGVRIEDLTMRGLLVTLRKHFEENGLEFPADMEAKVEDFMCRRLPEGFCYGDLDGRPRAKVLTLNDIKQNTQRLVIGSTKVSPGEARRRNLICGRCDMNDRTLCPSCVGLVSWARRLVGAQLGAADDWVGVCVVDGTAIAAKVHVADVPDNDEYPENCWRREQ